MARLSDLQALWETSRRYQALADEIDLLQPQKWLETDDTALRGICQKIEQARLAQRRLLVEDNVPHLLDRLEGPGIPQLTPNDQAMVRAMRRFCSSLLPLGENDIRAMEKVTAESEKEWLESFEIAESQGKEAAFAVQKQALDRVFGLRRSLSCKVAEDTGMKPSEVPLDEWNPWMRNNDVDDLFRKARQIWPGLFLAVEENAALLPDNPFTDGNHPDIAGKFSEKRQLAFFKQIQQDMLQAAGWGPEELAHAGVTLREPDFLPNPFCWGTRQEAWMTIENRSGDFFVGLGNTLHETGHLLYLLSLNRQPEQLKDTPLAQVNGYGIHEVSSMYFEQAASDPKFWELIAPKIHEHFGVNGEEWRAENLCALMNAAQTNDTGWGASELSLMPNMYFRTMAERRILDGEMEVGDLPAFWAQTMTETTGKEHRPEDFFVDESHWFDRQTGYFPSYWIGALSASRLHEIKDNDRAAETGDLQDYFRIHYETLDDKILRHAAKDRPLDLIQRELGGAPADFLPSYVTRLMTNYAGQQGEALAANIMAKDTVGTKAPRISHAVP